MNNQSVFLSAEWRNLAMVNYEIDPSVLEPFVPKGTELDLWNDKAFVSLVGFMFLNTKVWGVPVPFHRNFEEMNLRFYIKRRHPDGDRRAVAFIKEIVPRRAIAFLARLLYNENYVALPMRHKIEKQDKRLSAEYSWKSNEKWQHLGVQCKGDPFLPEKGSLAEFITEHYWGYVKQRNEDTFEYKVSHPQWHVWEAEKCSIDIDVETLYGPTFAPYLNKTPISAFLAEGSSVTVSKANSLSHL